MRYTLLAVFVLSACAHRQATDTREHEQDQEAGSGGGAGLGTTAAYVFSRMAPGRFTTAQTYPQFFGERVTGVAIAPSSVTAVSYTATAGSNVDALILTAGAELQWGAGSAILSGTSDEVTAEGTFQSLGTLTAADYRPIGTTAFDLNSHVASGTTAFTFDASSTLAAGLHSSWRETGTSALMTLDHAGALAPISISTNGTATFGGTMTAQTSAVFGDASANELTAAGGSTSNPVTLTATGSDTDVDVNVVPKGAGSLEVSSREVAVFGNTSRAATIMCFGEKATSSGTVTLTFTDESCEAFGGTPVCLCGNTSNTTENACATTGESTTQVTLNGTTSDTYTWVCFGARP